MKILLKFFHLICFLLIVSKTFGKLVKQTKNYEKVENFRNKSLDLNTSDNYVKRAHVPYGDHETKNVNPANSYLKEVQYYHNREFAYEKKFHWDSDSDKEIVSKKIKKDLYNNKNYGKTYNNNEMIEVHKWDDNESDNQNYNNNENNHVIHNYENTDDNYRDNYKRRESYENHSDEGEEKWFKNSGNDKNTENSSEVNDEDNYNNFNSPKFIVNYHKFKPWSKLIKSRSYDNNETDDEKPVYESEPESQYRSKRLRDDNYNDFNDEYIRHKSSHKEIVSELRNGPKILSYYNDRHISPHNYGWAKSESHKSPFDFGSKSMRDQISRKFIEMPFDHLFRYGLQDIHKNSNKRSSAKIREYRYGF